MTSRWKNPAAWSKGIRIALAGALALFSVTCTPTQVPPVGPPPDPFVRYPYLQAVTDTSADVLWMTAPSIQDTLLYWIEAPLGAGSVPGSPTAGRRTPAPARAAPDTIRLAPADTARRRAVHLGHLPPDTRVGYRIITAPPRRETPVIHFRTGPETGTEEPVTALVFGDSGSGSRAQVDLARLMEQRKADLILHVGDVAYRQGTAEDFTLRHFRVYRTLLDRVPLFPAPGNHDLRTDGGRPFENAFVLPGRGAAGAEPPKRLYYSFDRGRVHFVALDSNPGSHPPDSDLRNRGVQYEWLERDLAKASADPRIDWIIVFFHHPPYTAARDFFSQGKLVGNASQMELRRVLVPLFDRYGVDLVLTGHEHDYERSLPLRGDRVDRRTPGTTYVVTGGGGGRLEWRGVGRAWFTAVSTDRYEFVTLRIGRATIQGEAVGRDGRTLDRFRLRPVPSEGAGDEAPAGAG